MGEQADRMLPKYRSHKEVWALKIKSTHREADGSGTLFFEEAGFAPRAMDASFMARAQDGEGYFVQYEDGYMSWSPVKAFEDGYVRI